MCYRGSIPLVYSRIHDKAHIDRLYVFAYNDPFCSSLDLHDTAAILMGCSAMHSPTIRSLIVGSVDPLKQGPFSRIIYGQRALMFGVL